MSLIRKHVAVLQAWACLDLVIEWQHYRMTWYSESSSQTMRCFVVVW